MDSSLLTLENNRFHLHACDGIRAVRIDRLVAENDQPFTHDPGLSLNVTDEDNLVLWSEKLASFAQPDTPAVAYVGREFAVWESLTIGITRFDESTSSPKQDVLLRLYYTLNPAS